MKLSTLETLRNENPRMIDLTRHRPTLHGSLSPSGPEPASRRLQRQDADEFTSNAVSLLLLFILLATALLTYALHHWS